VLGLPLQHRLARRHDRGPQAALTRAARGGNVHDAFVATQRLDRLHVAIVDDVMTTGATLGAAACAAADAGARVIEVWAVARTLR
jgi:predicted amidophosphoribosyltransferase